MTLPAVYVAGPWARRSEAQAVARRLRAAGFVVTSRWVDRPDSAYECDPALMRAEAFRDIEDIDQADALLYLNLQKSEGKATELGMALARQMPVYAVGGTMNNVFLHLPVVTHVPTVEAFISLWPRCMAA